MSRGVSANSYLSTGSFEIRAWRVTLIINGYFDVSLECQSIFLFNESPLPIPVTTGPESLQQKSRYECKALLKSNFARF